MVRRDMLAYKNDPTCLGKYFFKRVPSLSSDIDDNESEEEKLLMDGLLASTIEPYTLLQGTADWHYFRKFSLTSSQAHRAFLSAITLHHNDQSWIALAEYLYGEDWRDVLKIQEEAEEETSEEQATEDEDAEDAPFKSIQSCVQANLVLGVIGSGENFYSFLKKEWAMSRFEN